MKAVDLHVHSNYSDGTNSVKELVELACEKGLKAIALTDHDTTDGIEEILIHAKDRPIEIVPGIEFSTEYLGRDIHILGLYVNPYHPAFCEHIRTFRESRDIRNRKMCTRLSEMGVCVTYEELSKAFEGSVLTRAHYARYLMEKGYVKNMREAFERYVGDHCPAFVPREKITPNEAVTLILKTGGIPVLAHPILYRFSDRVLETLVESLKASGLVGIETIYSTYAPSEERYIRRMAKRFDLIITGGSDYHGSNKPDISLGTGRGHLYVPEECLDSLKASYLRNYATTPAEKSILFFDLDGTLLDDTKSITAQTMEALRACVNRGHVLAISSGRSHISIRKIIEHLSMQDLNPLISAFNGSHISDYNSGEILYSAGLNKELVSRICEIAKEQGLHLQSYSETQLLTQEENDELFFYTKWTGMNYKLTPNLALECENPFKLLAIHLTDHSKLVSFKATIEEMFGSQADCVFSNEFFLEILPKGVSKGSALHFLCEHTGIDRSHSYAFADAENDISMLEKAGCGVALLNAHPLAKAAADYITFTDNNHDGLAVFLQKLAGL